MRSRDNMRKPYLGQKLTFQSAGVTLKSYQHFTPPKNVFV